MTSNDATNPPCGPASSAQVDDRDLSMTERFERFHTDNPHFYAALVDLARRYITRTGRTIVGMQRLVEVARFDLDLRAKTDEEFKVNNDFAAYYSRLIMWQEPDLAGVIPIRRSPEADAWITSIKNGRAA